MTITLLHSLLAQGRLHDKAWCHTSNMTLCDLSLQAIIIRHKTTLSNFKHSYFQSPLLTWRIALEDSRPQRVPRVSQSHVAVVLDMKQEWRHQVWWNYDSLQYTLSYKPPSSSERPSCEPGSLWIWILDNIRTIHLAILALVFSESGNSEQFCVFFINMAAFLYVKVKFTRMTRDQEDEADKFATFLPQIIWQ